MPERRNAFAPLEASIGSQVTTLSAYDVAVGRTVAAIRHPDTEGVLIKTHTHHAHGWHITSSGLVAGLGSHPGSPTDHRVDLDWLPPAPMADGVPSGRPTVRFELGGALRYSASRDDDLHRFRVAGCSEFTITPEFDRVVCRPAPDVEHDLTTLLASGAVLSYALTMRGHCVLHASAVEIDGDAVALVGASGFGKSTVTAGLCATGCQLVTDDVLRVDLQGAAVAHRGAREIRLRPAARVMAGDFDRTPDARETADGRLAIQPPMSSHATLPLSAIVLPQPSRDRKNVSLDHVSPAAALKYLLRFPRVLGWRDIDVLTQQFDQMAVLAHRVPFFVAELPWGPPFSRDASLQLAAELSARLRQVSAPAATSSK